MKLVANIDDGIPVKNKFNDYCYFEGISSHECHGYCKIYIHRENGIYRAVPHWCELYASMVKKYIRLLT